MAFVYAWIVPLWADQLLPQLLMEQFDTLRNNVDTLNICMREFILLMEQFDTLRNNVDTLNTLCMREFIIFVCTDSTEVFSKLRSAGLNYNLPSFFTDSCCAGGI